MAKRVQRRRGTTAEHSTFTGALGEWTHDTTNHQIVAHDGTLAGGYPLVHAIGRRCFVFETDFIGLPAEMSTNVSGAGALFTGTATAAVPGRTGHMRLTTGTDVTGRAGFQPNNGDCMLAGGGAIHFETSLLWSGWSGASESGTFRCGLMGNVTTEPANGIYFRQTLTTGTNSVFSIVCRQAGTETAVPTAVTPTAGQYVRLGIVVNAAGTSAEFFINGTSVGSIVTNIPVVTGYGPSASVIKSAGTTAIFVDFDYMTCYKFHTTLR